MRSLHLATIQATTKEHQAAVRSRWAILGEHFDDLERLTHADLVEYVRTRQATPSRAGGCISGQSIRKELQILQRGLALARLEKLSVPVIGEWPTVRTSETNPARAGKLHPKHVVSAWLRELMDTTDKRRRPLAGIHAVLCARTGLRAKELSRLRVSWVEEAPAGSATPALLRIPAPSSKTRRERVVGLDQEALQAIHAALEVVKDQAGRLVPGDYKKARAGAQERIGYGQTITLRDLRHCYCTWGADGGANLIAVRDAMGHTSLRTTSRYVHATEAETLTASALVSEALSTGTPHRDPPDDSSCTEAAGGEVRDTGFEPVTFGSGGRGTSLIREGIRRQQSPEDIWGALVSAGLVKVDRDPQTGTPLAAVS